EGSSPHGLASHSVPSWRSLCFVGWLVVPIAARDRALQGKRRYFAAARKGRHLHGKGASQDARSCQFYIMFVETGGFSAGLLKQGDERTARREEIYQAAPLQKRPGKIEEVFRCRISIKEAVVVVDDKGRLCKC